MKHIRLWKSKNELSNKVSIVDDEDWEEISKYKWYTCVWKPDGSCYSRATVPHPQGGKTSKGSPRRARIMMHRFLMAPPEGYEVDHINHNKLDNRRCNLRVCTRAENGRNIRKTNNRSSRYKGVSRSKKGPDMINNRSKQWTCGITYDGEYHWVGMYATEEHAALVYDEWAQEHHGEFACLNFPDGPTQEVLDIIKKGTDGLPVKSSEYLGVTATGRMASSCVTHRRKNIYLGSYPSSEEAALRRDKKIIELGISGKLNFPDGPTEEISRIIENAREKYRAEQDKLYIYKTKYYGVKNPKGKLYYVMFVHPFEKKLKNWGSYWTLREAKEARDNILNEFGMSVFEKHL